MKQTSVLPVLTAVVCLGLATALTGCSQSAVHLVSRSGSAPITRPSPPSGPGRYVIQPHDLLFITFASEPDYNQQVRVDWRGKIDVPTLAATGSTEVSAAGLTPAELADRVTALGRKNSILLEQRAQVFVSEYAEQSFSVLGQVNQPGRYFFEKGRPPQLDLGDAIAMGGGYTRLARQSRVLVKRGGQVYCVDLRRLTTSGRETFPVRPGDIITVAERIF